METISALAEAFPELIKLGGWGVLVALFLLRRITTKGEKDEAVAAERERSADKDKQIAVLQRAVEEDSRNMTQIAQTMEKMAAAWEALVRFVPRPREEGRG